MDPEDPNKIVATKMDKLTIAKRGRKIGNKALEHEREKTDGTILVCDIIIIALFTKSSSGNHLIHTLAHTCQY